MADYMIITSESYRLKR